MKRIATGLLLALIPALALASSYPSLQGAAKASDTTRAGPTVSLDPDLQFTGQPAGTYALTCYLVFKVPATSEDIAYMAQTTGAATLGRFQADLADNLGTDLGSANSEINYYPLETNPLTPNTMVSMTVNSTIGTSSTGTIGFSWGEYDGTGGMTLRAGSWCELARIL